MAFCFLLSRKRAQKATGECAQLKQCLLKVFQFQKFWAETAQSQALRVQLVSRSCAVIECRIDVFTTGSQSVILDWLCKQNISRDGVFKPTSFGMGDSEQGESFHLIGCPDGPSAQPPSSFKPKT